MSGPVTDRAEGPPSRTVGAPVAARDVTAGSTVRSIRGGCVAPTVVARPGFRIAVDSVSDGESRLSGSVSCSTEVTGAFLGAG